MPELIVLGSAASVPDAGHDTTALALRGSDWAVLIECGGSPLYKLAQFGISPSWVRAVILTHHHADHLYGLPILIQGLWLSGRRTPLPVYGPPQTLEICRRLLDLFELPDPDDGAATTWHSIPRREGYRVLQIGEVTITATPVAHGPWDTRAIRLENPITGRSIVYSSDTEPCPALVRLAAGADLLVHETTGHYPGHSSPREAAEVAREAGVARLALIHYPVYGADPEAWRRAAVGFGGPTILARDGDVYPL